MDGTIITGGNILTAKRKKAEAFLYLKLNREYEYPARVEKETMIAVEKKAMIALLEKLFKKDEIPRSILKLSVVGLNNQTGGIEKASSRVFNEVSKIQNIGNNTHTKTRTKSRFVTVEINFLLTRGIIYRLNP